ncbi:MAG: hypothetical protein K2P87_09725 [Lachnospiraceae bacterium]|nr:hypothetical protein [Lachnospiraceae bacterium]
MKQKMTDFLLANAGPSIRLRVKKEILNNISAQEERELQNEILNEKTMKLIAAKQLPNGWIGLGFHGSNKNAGQYDNQEVATKYMGEKGLFGTELLNRAMDAFVTTELTDPCYGTRGHYYSEFEIPACGQNTIRCACIARAHYDDLIDITPQINVALESFRRVTEVDSIHDVSRPTKKCRLFNSGERWPCRYHLETLAFTTKKWRDEKNTAMLTEAFRQLLRADRPEIINTPVACWVGHALGPLWYLNEGYSIAGDGQNHLWPDGIRRVNFEKTEWLVRCGLYTHLAELKEEVDYILSQVDRDGICRAQTYEGEFRGWSPYFGLQLETDWRAKVRKSCDFTFRALLIAHYAGL